MTHVDRTYAVSCTNMDMVCVYWQWQCVRACACTHTHAQHTHMYTMHAHTYTHTHTQHNSSSPPLSHLQNNQSQYPLTAAGTQQMKETPWWWGLRSQDKQGCPSLAPWQSLHPTALQWVSEVETCTMGVALGFTPPPTPYNCETEPLPAWGKGGMCKYLQIKFCEGDSSQGMYHQ